jgi:hypothetical protein
VDQYYLGSLTESDLQNLNLSYTISLGKNLPPPGVSVPLTIFGFVGDGVFSTSDFGGCCAGAGGVGGFSPPGTALATFSISLCFTADVCTYTFDLDPGAFAESLLSNGNLWLGLDAAYFGLPDVVYGEEFNITTVPEPSTFDLLISVCVCVAAICLLRHRLAISTKSFALIWPLIQGPGTPKNVGISLGIPQTR